MQKSTIITLFIYSFIHTMEKPPQPITYRQPKTLAEIATLKSVENIKSIQEFTKIIAVTPKDLHCDLVKKLIHNKKFTREQVIELINTYCNKDPLLKAYTYFSRITPENREKSIMSMRGLLTAAQFQRNQNAISLIREFITLAQIPEVNLSPIRVLINTNRIELIEPLLSLGERPTLEDLGYAIILGNTRVLQLLLNANPPLHDPKLRLTEQPLYLAFEHLNENMINTLLQNGVSLDTLYPVPNINQKQTIAVYLRNMINQWNYSWVFPGKTMQQTQEYFESLKKLLNKFAPEPHQPQSSNPRE